MSDNYYINFKAVTIEEYRESLKSNYLIPSMRILKENIDANFKQIKATGIDNLQDLLEALKKKEDISTIASQTGIDEKYLTILKRDAYMNKPKPVPLKKFTSIDNSLIEKLASIKIKNSIDLFRRITTPVDRKNLAEEIDISPGDLIDLVKLTDLVRLKFVGPAFAQLCLLSSANTPDKLASKDPELLHKELLELGRRGLYKGPIGFNDISLLVKIASDLPKKIEY